MIFEFREVAKLAFYCKFDSRYEMTATFLRLGEYYESPNNEFRGKFFHHDDFARWYAAERNGRFTYFDDWGGYNIPSHVIRSFLRDFPLYMLTHDELVLFTKLHPILRTHDKFYLIAGDKNLKGVLEHELAHAYYYLHPDYKEKQDAHIELLPKKVKQTVVNELIKVGYGDEVIHDEIQAYLSTTPNDLECCEDVKPHVLPFHHAFKTHHEVHRFH